MGHFVVDIYVLPKVFFFPEERKARALYIVVRHFIVVLNSSLKLFSPLFSKLDSNFHRTQIEFEKKTFFYPILQSTGVCAAVRTLDATSYYTRASQRLVLQRPKMENSH